MIGPHSADIAKRLDQEIHTLRRTLTDQRPFGKQLAGVQGVIARGEKCGLGRENEGHGSPPGCGQDNAATTRA